MATKTTSGSGFHLGFVFYALDFVENEYNVEGVPRTIFEIFGVKVEKFKNLNDLQKNFAWVFSEILWPFRSSTTVQKFGKIKLRLED